MNRPNDLPAVHRAAHRGAATALLLALVAGGARVALGQGTVPPRAGADSAASRDSVPVLTLGGAARLAAKQSALAQTAQYRAREAAARVRQSRSAILPDLNATGSLVRRNFNTASFGLSLPGFPPGGFVPPAFNLYDLRGHAQWDVLDLSAFERVRAAQAAARASGAEATNSAELAATQAATAYLQLLRTESQLEARAADSALAADLLSIARSQLNAGTGIGLDVTRAQAQLTGVVAQLIAARNARDRAQLDLRRALGLPLDAPVALADSLDELPAADSLADEQALTEQALRDRPDLRAAEQQLQAARRAVTATKAERLPSLAVFGDKGATGVKTDALLNTYQVGAQVSLPIFDGFRREGRIEEQQAQVQEAAIRQRDLQQQAAVDVRGALLDLASARQQVAAARERLRLAEQEVAQARERFAAGVSGNADVIQASLSLNAARNLLIDALTGYQVARVSLARATGSVTTLR